MSNKITGKVLAVQLGREESHLVLLSNAGEVQHAVTLPTPWVRWTTVPFVISKKFGAC